MSIQAQVSRFTPTIDYKTSPLIVAVGWWLVKSVVLGAGLTLLPILAFGPPLWWLASINHALLTPDVEHLTAVFKATVICVVWGGCWTALVTRKGVSR